MENIMVSICCLAYNHEKYIADALDGFLMQKTSFPFEIIIHDDASTDQTAQIIREYEEKYPYIIKPIYQTENQYSKNIKIMNTLVCPAAKGKYIAVCEGDDYWTDPYKLQQQVDYMESHPECTLCFTNGQCESTGQLARRIVPWVKWNQKAYLPGDADYNMGQMVLLDYVPTASLLFRATDILSMPTFSSNSFTGDTCIRLYLTSLGYAHCIDKDTCIYRFGLTGSATTQWNKNAAKSVAFIEKLCSLLNEMNELTQYKYDAQISEVKLRTEFKAHMALHNYPAARQKKFHTLYRADGKNEYAKYLLSVYLPWCFPVLRNFSRKLRGKK